MQDMTTTQKTLKPKHLPVNTELAPSTSCISPKYVDARVPSNAILVFVAAFSGMN